MPDALSSYARRQALQVMCGVGSWSVETPHVQLHVGDPGPSGVASVAQASARKPLNMAAWPDGEFVNSDELLWGSGEVVADESLTWFTVWTGRVGGEFLWSGRLSASAVLAGDEFRIPVGALRVTIEEPA